jgi:hypothetical protein
MTLKTKLFLGIGILFAGVMLFIIGSSVFLFFVMPQIAGKRAVELNLKRSAETSGTITDVSHYKSSGSGKYGGSGSWSSTFTYQYEVNGVAYSAKDTRSGKVDGKNGLKVRVCYDPSDPKSAEFYYLEDNKICGKLKP